MRVTANDGVIGDTYLKQFQDNALGLFASWLIKFRTISACAWLAQNGYFNLILISYNTIDYGGHEGRNHIFYEVKRLLKCNGIYICSSHNINSLSQNYSPRGKKSLATIFKNTILYLIFILLNGIPGRIQKHDWYVVKDNAHRFRLKTYYIKPIVQVKRLEDMGFKDIQVFSLTDGVQIMRDKIAFSNDPWCYYSCRK